MTTFSTNFKSLLIKKFGDILSKNFPKDFLVENKLYIYTILKNIYESKLISEIILSYDDEKLFKIFKYFAEKRKAILDILFNFNTKFKIDFNMNTMNKFIEYIIFFVNINCDNDVTIFYEDLLKNIKKYPLLYPEFILY